MLFIFNYMLHKDFILYDMRVKLPSCHILEEKNIVFMSQTNKVRPLPP